ncbi:hypothetical protein F2P81_007499 [Scophthalmus maximus]|uniref:Uncharacterized protein n=1 Tax=Scophthalmus maximus TaxID=52904 RepID=A0A6A4T7T1_SCOMX|nr:hypothetical protein F2P81_007499 [Scophthalmus maximus]
MEPPGGKTTTLQLFKKNHQKGRKHTKIMSTEEIIFDSLINTLTVRTIQKIDPADFSISVKELNDTARQVQELFSGCIIELPAAALNPAARLKRMKIIKLLTSGKTTPGHGIVEMNLVDATGVYKSLLLCQRDNTSVLWHLVSSDSRASIISRANPTQLNSPRLRQK